VTATLTTSPATDTAVADLVLVRMTLPGTKPVAPSAVRKDVGKLLDSELSAADFDELRNELASAGFLAKGKRNTFVLTDAGRERALRFLGVAELPARTNWSTVIAKHLFPKAAELSSDAADELNNGDKLAAFVLKRKYGLSAAAGSTVNQVLEAVVCKQLRFPRETTLDGLLRGVLNQLIGTENLPKDQLVKQLPLFETGLKTISADSARCKVVKDWLRSQRNAPQSPEQPEPRRLEHEPFDLFTFAATVRKLAADSPSEDRFHDNKVFIAALWRASQREPSFPRASLAEFKQRLVEANSQNLLRLSRADLVQAMDPQLVADSEAVYLNAAFHFVLLEGDHS
jgi:hypothetical protein